MQHRNFINNFYLQKRSLYKFNFHFIQRKAPNKKSNFLLALFLIQTIPNLFGKSNKNHKMTMLKSEDIIEQHLYKPDSTDYFLWREKSLQRFIYHVKPAEYTEYELKKLRKLQNMAEEIYNQLKQTKSSLNKLENFQHLIW